MSTLATTACISQLPSEEHSGSYDHCRRRGKPPGRSTPPCLTKAKRPPAAACREALVVRWCGVGLDGRDDRGVRQVDTVYLEATGDLGLAEQVALSEVHVHERAFRARHGADRCAAGGGEAAGLAGQVETGDLLAVAAVQHRRGRDRGRTGLGDDRVPDLSVDGPRRAVEAGHLVVSGDLLGASGELERADALVEGGVVPAKRGLDVALADEADAVVDGDAGAGDGRGGEKGEGGERDDLDDAVHVFVLLLVGMTNGCRLAF